MFKVSFEYVEKQESAAFRDLCVWLPSPLRGARGARVWAGMRKRDTLRVEMY
jgi:hypothetical protein